MRMWTVLFGRLRPVSSLLEKLCACKMTEEAAELPAAKRPCTEERSTDVSEQGSESAIPLAGSREGEEDDARGESAVPVKTCMYALS